MAAVSAQTRQTMTAISGLIQLNQVNQASVELTKLIRDLVRILARLAGSVAPKLN